MVAAKRRGNIRRVPRGMLRPLEGEGEAQRSLGVGVTWGNIRRVPRGMLRPLEGEGGA